MNERFLALIDSLDKFWRIVADVWQQGIFGLTLGQVFMAAVVFLLFFVLRQLIGRLVLRNLLKLTRKTRFTFDDKLVRAIDAPMRFVPVVLGAFFAFEILDVSGEFAEFSYRLIRSLVALVVFWALYNLIDPLIEAMRKLESVVTDEMVEWLTKAIRVTVVFLGAAAVLEVWGIAVGPILAGLGLIGVAVALGAQDLFKNLIAGMLVLIEKRFSHGDWINVDGVVEGNVEAFGIRSTLVRRFDKAPVYVPNAMLSDNAVTNYSRMLYRRIYWRIGVLYSTTAGQLRAIRDQVNSYVCESDDFADPSEVATFVRIDSFNDSSIDILVYCFTRTKKWGEWLEVKERLAYEIKRIVEEAGTGFAFPSRSVYIETPASESAEAFVPPGVEKARPAAENDGA